MSMSNYKATPMSIDLGPSDSVEASGRTCIIYGDSTAGKSTQLAAAAEYLTNKHNKPVRLISAEDSTKTVFMPLILGGLVDARFISKIKDPVPTLRRFARGDWPIDNNNEWLTVSDNNSCAYIVEGLSTIAELIQEDCREKGRFLGEQKENSHVEQGETLALPGKFSYNFTQMEMIRLLKSFAMITGLERVIWSAHETKGVEEGTGAQLRGPALVGSAKTGSVSKYCGLLLHLDMLSEKGAVIHRLHYTSHPDPKIPTTTSPAKTTVPLLARADFINALGGEKGYIDTTVKDGQLLNSLADVLRAEDLAIEKLVTKYRTGLDKAA